MDSFTSNHNKNVLKPSDLIKMARSKNEEPTKKQSTKTKTTKGKASKAKDGKAKKPKKVSDLPKIVRPRVFNKDSFEEYIDSFVTNVEYRRDVVKQLYDDKKCPNACVLHLNAILKEIGTMKKRVGKRIITKRRNNGNHERGALVAPRLISDELAKFLGVKPGTRMGRDEVNRAVTAYIHYDPAKKLADPKTPEEEKSRKNKAMWVKKLNKDGKVRNLQDATKRSIIHPDAALSKLLKYKEYQKLFKKGEVVFNRTDKETGTVSKQAPVTDELNYSVLQHLLAPHFIKDDEPVETPEEPVADSDDEDASDVEEDDD